MVDSIAWSVPTYQKAAGGRYHSVDNAPRKKNLEVHVIVVDLYGELSKVMRYNFAKPISYDSKLIEIGLVNIMKLIRI